MVNTAEWRWESTEAAFWNSALLFKKVSILST